MNRERLASKFGGTSNAKGSSIIAGREIISSDTRRRVIVVSAPGEDEFNGDPKVTKLLRSGNFEGAARRFMVIAQDLGEQASVTELLNEVRAGMDQDKGPDWLLSRGEWIQANLVARVNGAEFLDATEVIRLNADGSIDPATYRLIREKFDSSQGRLVIPGFYGLGPDGKVKTFPSGGSDISGAVVARGIEATLYENWTDVNGLRAAHPKVVNNPKVIPEISYEEMREMAYNGAEVLQRDTVLPLFEVGIPVNIRNTFNPKHPGTMVVLERKSSPGETVIGIAGRDKLAVFEIKKVGMNDQRGIAGNILDIFAQQGVSIEHPITGIDTVSIVVGQEQLDGQRKPILEELARTINPTRVKVLRDLSIVCIVGQGIENDPTGVILKLSYALETEESRVEFNSFPTSKLSSMVGIPSRQYRDATNALYRAFIEK